MASGAVGRNWGEVSVFAGTQTTLRFTLKNSLGGAVAIQGGDTFEFWALNTRDSSDMFRYLNTAFTVEDATGGVLSVVLQAGDTAPRSRQVYGIQLWKTNTNTSVGYGRMPILVSDRATGTIPITGNLPLNIVGLLKGTGTTIVAAVADTDYATPAALNLKANIDSPTFSGVVQVGTSSPIILNGINGAITAGSEGGFQVFNNGDTVISGYLTVQGDLIGNSSWLIEENGTATLGTINGNTLTNGSGTFTLATYTLVAVESGNIATRAYVDLVAQGMNPKPVCDCATTGALPACTYNNGTLGVGATLTGNSNAPLPGNDAVSPTVGQVILVKDQAGSQNGIYTVTQVGSGSLPFILTRHVDMDSATEFVGYLAIKGGTLQAGALFISNIGPTTVVVVGTTSVSFTRINKATDLQAGTGISISGNTVSVAPTLTGEVLASSTFSGTQVGPLTLTGQTSLVSTGTTCLTIRKSDAGTNDVVFNVRDAANTQDVFQILNSGFLQFSSIGGMAPLNNATLFDSGGLHLNYQGMAIWSNGSQYYGGNVAGIGLNALANYLEVNTGTLGVLSDLLMRALRLNPLTFASLPASPLKGQCAYITDCNSVVFRATAASGGANNIMVVYDGTVWRVGG